MAGQVKAACHCGAISLSVTPVPSKDGSVDITICHCDSCRHVTGELFVSYMPIHGLSDPGLDGTSEYGTVDGWTRRFCATCGCHLFRTRGLAGESEWEVATGILTGQEDPAKSPLNAQYKRHVAVSETLDGGSSVWLTEINGQKMETPDGQVNGRAAQLEHPSDTLPGSCACGTVSFRITRPDETSLLPSSYLPDLTHAYCSTDPSIIANPSDTKWWLRPDSKYLAGTCACRSCRLVSGFEIQSWAFVPRSNIHFHVPQATTSTPLDFDTLPAGILKSYTSSPNVVREFCGKCGATVFWRGRLRPELMDVSVGSLRGGGARAEGWLEWWTDRVSFSEDAETGRAGEEARRARVLVDALETGLKAWAQGS